MSQQSTRSDHTEDVWEKKVQEIAGRVTYPATPDIAGAVHDRIGPRSRHLLITRLAPRALRGAKSDVRSTVGVPGVQQRTAAPHLRLPLRMRMRRVARLPHR